MMTHNMMGDSGCLHHTYEITLPNELMEENKRLLNFN
jgi:hypothetical protein